MSEQFKTRRQLVEQALDNLGVLATGQAPEPEDVDKMDKLVDPLLATLSADEVYYLPIVEETPLEAFLPLSHVLADAAKSSFGRSGDPDLSAEAEGATKTLKRLSRPARTRRRLRIDPLLTGCR